MDGIELMELRKRTGLTRDKFAVLVLGIGAQTLGYWERGTRKIPQLAVEGIRSRTAAWNKKHGGPVVSPNQDKEILVK
mgnify:CR=1 FL=1